MTRVAFVCVPAASTCETFRKLCTTLSCLDPTCSNYFNGRVFTACHSFMDFTIDRRGGSHSATHSCLLTLARSGSICVERKQLRPESSPTLVICDFFCNHLISFVSVEGTPSPHFQTSVPLGGFQAESGKHRHQCDTVFKPSPLYI